MDKFEILKPVTAPLNGRPSAVFQDAMIILGAILVLALLLVLWAKYGRNWKRQRSEYRKAARRSAAASREFTEPGSDASPSIASHSHHHHSRRRKKFRRRREEHRQRNPTLAETGGLPPLREEQTVPPQQ